MSIYDRLEELNQAKSAATPSSTTGKSARMAEGQSPISRNGRVKKRPVAIQPSPDQPVAEPTSHITHVSDPSRDRSRGNPREKPRDWPSREEVQEFTFRLRDDLKVKLQAEVPHQWQAEFEDIARHLKVKKLELYRYILGEFLGKVRRK